MGEAEIFEHWVIEARRHRQPNEISQIEKEEKSEELGKEKMVHFCFLTRCMKLLCALKEQKKRMDPQLSLVLKVGDRRICINIVDPMP